MSNANIWTSRDDAKIPAMLRELRSDLTEMVRTGDLTDEQANEWLNCKAEQWAGGLS